MSLAALPSLHLSAATITKANNTTAISSAGSWVGGVLPAAGDVMLFDSTITGALTTSGAASMSAATAFQFTTIGGNVTVGVSNGSTITLNNATPTYTIDMSAAAADVTLGTTVGSTGTIRWASTVYGGISVATGRTLTFNSALSNAGNTKTITMTGGGNIVFNGSAGSGGAMGFSIQGGTNVTMNGTGGWSGTSLKTVLQGTLNLGSDTALGSATLSLGGSGTTDTPTLTATGAARTITNGLTLLAVTTGNATIAGTNALTINGTLLNSGGNRTLSVNNSALTTFGGAVNLSEGSSNRTLTINGTGNTTISGIIANGGTSTASSLTYSGAGLLSLTNANTFTGTLTASSGTTRIDNSLAAQNATVSVGVANAVAFGTGVTTAAFGGLAGAGDLALVNTDTTAVALTVGGNNASTSYTGTLSGPGTLTKTGSGTLSVSNTANAVAITVTGGTVNGSGTTAGTNGGFGTGDIILDSGTLSSSMGSSNTLAFANKVTVDTGATGTINTPNRMNWTGVVTGAGTLNVNVSTTVSRLDFQNDWTGFSGNLNLTGTGGIRLFNNGGTFVTNSFQNTTMDIVGAVSLNPQTNSGGNTYQIGSLASANTSAALNGGSSGRATYSVGGLDTSTTFAGTINGNAALTKVGVGTQTLTGTNTYTGATTVSAGALQVGVASTGTTGTGAVTVASGASLQGTGTVQGSSVTIVNGAIVQAGDGTAQANYGTLSFTPTSGSGAFDFQNGSNTILGINPGGVSDLLSFTGTGSNSLLFNGDLAVTAASYFPTAPEVFNLLDWAGLVSAPTFASRFSSGSYSGLLLGNGDDNLGFDLPNIAGSGYGWDISNFTSNGTIAAVLLVPEPSRALLLMLGVASGLLTRRRNRSSVLT